MSDSYAVFQDVQRHTCIRLTSDRTGVSFIAMGTPLEVTKLTHREFELRFITQLDNYPVKKAAASYLGATWLGITEQAREHLEYLSGGSFEDPIKPLDFQNKESIMTEAAKNEADAKKAAAPAAKPDAKKAAAPAAKPDAKKAAAPAAKPDAKKAAAPAAKPDAKKAAAPAAKPDAKKAAAPAAKPAPAPKLPKANTPRIKYADSAKITVNAKENPYRDGSKAYATFALFAKAKTVGAFKAMVAEGEYDGNYLHYASRDKFITIT